MAPSYLIRTPSGFIDEALDSSELFSLATNANALRLTHRKYFFVVACVFLVYRKPNLS